MAKMFSEPLAAATAEYQSVVDDPFDDAQHLEMDERVLRAFRAQYSDDEPENEKDRARRRRYLLLLIVMTCKISEPACRKSENTQLEELLSKHLWLADLLDNRLLHNDGLRRIRLLRECLVCCYALHELRTRPTQAY